MDIKKLVKPGINKAITCKKCGHKVGFVTIKPKMKWKMFWQLMAIAFIMEFFANLIVYFIFR